MVEIHQFAPVSYQLAEQNNLWLASGTGWLQLLLGTSSTIVHHAYVGPAVDVVQCSSLTLTFCHHPFVLNLENTPFLHGMSVWDGMLRLQTSYM